MVLTREEPTRSTGNAPSTLPVPQGGAARRRAPVTARSSAALRGAWLGAALAVGWVAHDLVVFRLSGRPDPPWELAPGVVAAVLLVAALGGLVGRRPGVWFPGLLLLGVGVLVPLVTTGPHSAAVVWAPRILGLLWIALGLGQLLEQVGRPAPLRLGLSLGVVACAIVAASQIEEFRSSRILATAALAAAAAASLRPRTWRVVALAGVAAATFVLVGRRAVAGPGPVSTTERPTTAGVADAASPNLLFVILDTVRADHLAPYGSRRVTTPELDSFVAEHFTRYTHAWSTSSWSLPSHGSLFTGRFPSEHGATHAPGPGAMAKLRADVPTLAELLSAHGYRTAAIFANCVYLTPPFGMQRGFEHFDARRAGRLRPGYQSLVQLVGVRPDVGHTPYRRARKITDLALDWLDGRPQGPFFLALNYMDAHGPYLPPPPFDRAFGGERPADPLQPEPELLSLLYDREIASLDHQLGRLLEGLEGRDLLASTVVVVTSDHGEAFGEHGLQGHGVLLYDAVTRVPLFVKPKGLGRPSVDDTPVTGAGVFHLALAELGLAADAPAGETGWLGEVYRSPNPKSREIRTYGDRSLDTVFWVEGERKTIVRVDGRVEAYDLGLDPRESAPLALTPGEVDAALARARAFWSRIAPSTGPADGASHTTLASMAELGYL